MSNISVEKIISKLDSYLHKNDYESAERHLAYWLSEADLTSDLRLRLTVLNELMGLYRKLGKKEKALQTAEDALETVEKLGIRHQIGAATTYLNSATVYKAFGMPERAITLFEKAKVIYESELSPEDERLGGLYNNMALALVDLGRYGEAREAYQNAISVMEKAEDGALEVAITYLNMATAAETELGLEDSEEQVSQLLEKAQRLIDGFEKRDGHYAFVCEKCASVYGYYGYFLYENELKERAKRIYEGN